MDGQTDEKSYGADVQLSVITKERKKENMQKLKENHKTFQK